VPDQPIVAARTSLRVLVRVLVRVVLPLLLLLAPSEPEVPHTAPPPPPEVDEPRPDRSSRSEREPSSGGGAMDEELCSALAAYVTLERAPHELSSTGFDELMDLVTGEDRALIEQLHARNGERLEVYAPLVDVLREREAASGQTPVELLDRALGGFEKLEAVFGALLDGEEVGVGRLNIALVSISYHDHQRPEIIAWAAANCPGIDPPR
jgi:hypothetical protein